MWVLLIILLTPTGQMAGGISMLAPDHEACMVAGDRFVRDTAAMDTYHCVDMAALMAQGSGS
jgi:hypothetical protein